jgi:hypothetical protein
MAVAHFVVSSKHFPGGSEESRGKLLSGSRLEPMASQLQTKGIKEGAHFQ